MPTLSKRGLLSLLSLLLLLLSGCGTKETLTVVFPKLGSADGAVLLTQDATVVIDTGEASDCEGLLEVLQDYGRDTVDLLILSHYDKDHVGGAAALLEAYPVARVIGSTDPKDSTAMARYSSALAAAGLTEEVPDGPTTLTLGELSLTLYPPEESSYQEDASNNASLAVSVTYGNTSLLFTGDAMGTRTQELTAVLATGTYDFLKVPHHGRDTDTVSALLPTLKAGATALITSSKKEPESQAVLDLLEENGITPYLTRKGTVTVVSDGTQLTCTQE
jgi:beta-lactamase superfamily II metal-dependent hydrolase